MTVLLGKYLLSITCYICITLSITLNLNYTALVKPAPIALLSKVIAENSLPCTLKQNSSLGVRNTQQLMSIINLRCHQFVLYTLFLNLYTTLKKPNEMDNTLILKKGTSASCKRKILDSENVWQMNEAVDFRTSFTVSNLSMNQTNISF